MKLGGMGPHKIKKQLAQTPPLLYGLTFSCPRFPLNEPLICCESINNYASEKKM